MATAMKTFNIFSRFALSLLSALLIFGFSANSARADRRGLDFKPLHTLIKQAQSHCVRGQACLPLGLEFKTLFTANGAVADKDVLPLLGRFMAISQDQATIWADTILEGHFSAAGSTELNRIEGVYTDGQLIAYRIVYSEQAWRLGDEGEKAQEGRITEATYVSPNLTSWFRDEFGYALFE